jgi:hypothetical protein
MMNLKKILMMKIGKFFFFSLSLSLSLLLLLLFAARLLFGIARCCCCCVAAVLLKDASLNRARAGPSDQGWTPQPNTPWASPNLAARQVA